MDTIELIETLFDETRNTINQRLDTLERQVNLVLTTTMPQTTTTSNCCSPCPPSEIPSEFEFAKHFNSLSQKLAGISNFLDQMNYRLKHLEENANTPSQKPQTNLRTPILGPQHLEGLVMMSEIKVSKKDESDLDTKNIILQPHFTLPISDDILVDKEEQEEEEVEVIAEEEEEEQEEEEQQEEEQEEEEEEKQEEALELEEWSYKGKKYFKDQFDNIYRQIDEETPEDEPFAKYDEATKKLTRLSN